MGVAQGLSGPAVLHGDEFGENRQRRLGQGRAAQVEARGTGQPVQSGHTGQAVPALGMRGPAAQRGDVSGRSRQCGP